jgi:GMP synthase (glutamine-hydrolysing)
MKRLHYCQHVSFEGLGSIADWDEAAGFQISATRFFRNDPLPVVDDFEWLVIMGGPMNIYAEEAHPWLRDEKKIIRQAIERGKTVLGICLGAQLIADVLGAAVKANRNREIGWFPIYKTAAAQKVRVAAALPDKLPVLHWHGDTFDLPDGAVHLAKSDACDHQVFVFNQRVVALQFHLEATPQSLERLIRHCGSEIDGSPYVQDPAVMLADPIRFAVANKVMDRLLDELNHP